MKESAAIRFLYGTCPGRACLKLLTAPSLSRFCAKFLSSAVSAPMTGPFIRKNGIELKRYVVPKGGYRSFNDFFTRKQKKSFEIRCNAPLVSPCDALLTLSDIDSDSVFSIKNSRYSLAGLLRSRKLAAAFCGGSALIFRLTPAHYHRYQFCAGGTVAAVRKIPGVLHCVRPLALEKFPVFTENSREYIVMKNKELGAVVQMEVGAMLVGKISNHPLSVLPAEVSAGTEKGFFEYGGSTIIVLTKKRITLSPDIAMREKDGDEIPVKIGEALIGNA